MLSIVIGKSKSNQLLVAMLDGTVADSAQSGTVNSKFLHCSIHFFLLA